MKGRAINYTADELDWIEAHREMNRRDLHAAFVARFGRTDISRINLMSLCKRKGWSTGRTGQFMPGQVAHNKGKPMPYHPNSAATRFKTGERRGRANDLWKPIGTERRCKDGYLERKIHDGMPLQSRWRAVHLIRWEELNGDVPDGHCLKCLDGDRTNTDPSNWAAIPRALLPRLAGRWNQAYDDAEPEVRPALMATARLAHQARQARKKKSDAL